MTNKLIFDEAKQKYLEKLEQYVPIVARVHGKHHPEFHDVHKVFDTIIEKINAAGTNPPELSAEFAEMREITDHYTVPGDVCESYEAVYHMLSKMDQAYSA